MNERFQFLKTYGDTLIELEKADKQLARELAWKIIQYGIYNKDEDSGNPILEALFVQIRVMLDKGQDITEKRRKANSERTNIKQNKNKKEQKLTNKEQNLTNDEQTVPKDKREKIKDKKENIKEEINNNKLTLISEEKSSQYGNEEVNLCMSLIKKYNGGIINGSEAGQRKYAYNLIRKLQKVEGVKNGKLTRDELLNQILQIISGDIYHRTKISSPQLIFDNLGVLLQRCISITEQTTTQVPLQVI